MQINQRDAVQDPHMTRSARAISSRSAKIIGLVLALAALAALACSPTGVLNAEGTGGDGAFGYPPGMFPPGTAEWCAVEAILEDNCQNCHNQDLLFGAPMPLITHADLMASTPFDGRPAYLASLDRVRATVNPMPPPPNEQLSAADIATLQAWVDAGTPSGNCDVPTSGAGGTSNAGGSPSVGGTSSTGGAPSVGGAPSTGGNPNDYPADCVDCGDYACTDGTPIAFRAHQNPVPGDTEPFDAGTVGASGDPNSYECFYFKIPWSSTAQLIGHRPIIDNKRVMHHWLLYASDTPPLDLQDGGRRSRCQFQPDANRVLLAGWAPGTPGTNMPPNVGQALPRSSNAFVTLEIHYFNTQPGVEALDRSGVEVCLTDTPRQHEAAMHWLGTENISIPPMGQATAGDTCTPNQGQAATILRVWPHMHLTGTHAKLELIRSNGARETLHDRAFSFDNQAMYELDQPVVVNPGDHLDTRCTFENPEARTINFGEGSDEEMCYMFTLAYPAGALHNGRDGCLQPLGCVPGGIRRCIDNENILTAIGGL
jgi:hypothetical protein